MSVNLIKDWQLSTEGDLPTANSLSLIAFYYGVDFENSVDLLGDIAAMMGYNPEESKFFGVPYMQFISENITGNKDAEGGSYLQTIVNSFV
jgi:hypothetical protein